MVQCLFYLQSATGMNFLRPKQMNINVATWGRLMKRHVPTSPSNIGSEGFPSPHAPAPRDRGSIKDYQFSPNVSSTPRPAERRSKPLDTDPEVPKDKSATQEPEHEVKVSLLLWQSFEVVCGSNETT